MRIVIILNPRAGRFDITSMLQSVAEALREIDWIVDVWLTTQPGDVSRLARQARDGGAKAVFVAGGDGSLSSAANELAGTDVVLGVLPVGTANVWASELGLSPPLHPWSNALRSAALRQAQGEVRQVDMGVCNGRRFLLWAGLGLDAHIINRVEPRGRFMKRFGRSYYLLAASWIALSWRGVQMCVKVENTIVEREMLVAVVTNIRMYGGSFFRLDDAARIDDGKMSLRAFEGHSFLDAYKYLRALVPYYNVRVPEDHHFVGARFEVISARPVNLQLDGEVMGKVERAQIDIERETLNVFVPRAEIVPIFSNKIS